MPILQNDVYVTKYFSMLKKKEEKGISVCVVLGIASIDFILRESKSWYSK